MGTCTRVHGEIDRSTIPCSTVTPFGLNHDRTYRSAPKDASPSHKTPPHSKCPILGTRF